MEEAVRSGLIEEIRGYEYVRKEAFYQKSRFDLFLKKTETSGKNESCYIEVKGVTLEIEGTALFPDAPTERGARHIKELADARREGYRAAVIFLVQMDDIKSFAPNKLMDCRFAEALTYAHSEGVEVYSYNCRVSEEEIVINERVKVYMS